MAEGSRPLSPAPAPRRPEPEPCRQKPAPSNNTATSPARDPRRHSRQNSIVVPRSVSNVPPNPTPTTPVLEPTSYGDKVVESLTGISTDISVTTTLRADQAKARKTLGALNHHCEKLKNLDQFPAAKDLVCRIRDVQNNEVENLKQQLISRKDSQKRLAKQAAGLLNNSEARGPDSSAEKIQSIEVETKSTKLTIKNLAKDLGVLKNNNAAQTKENSELYRQIRAHTNELQSMRRSRQEDVEYLKKAQDRGIGQAFSDIRDLRNQIERQHSNRAQSTDQKRVDLLESDIAQLKNKVNTIVVERLNELENSQKAPAEINQRVLEALTNRLNAIEARLSQSPSLGIDQEPLANLTRQIGDVASRLTTLEISQVPNIPAHPPANPPANPNSALQAKYEHLQKVMQEIIDVQAFKDDQQMKLIEDNHIKIGEKLQETAVQVRSDIKSDFQKALRQVKDEQQLNHADQIANLKEFAEIHDSRLQTVETAITSLENRYGNITPESTVEQAMPIFQRIYPPPSILHGVIEGLRMVQLHLSNIPDFSNISAAIDNQTKQFTSMHSYIKQTNDDMSNRSNQTIAEMQRHKQQMEQKIEDLQKNFSDFNELRNSFLSFVRDNQQNFDSTQKNLQEINLERDRVAGEISAVNNRVNELQSVCQDQKAVLEQLKEIADPSVIANPLKELQGQLQDLDSKICSVVEAGDSAETESRLKNLEDAFKEQKQTLVEQFEQLESKQKATDAEVTSMLKSVGETSELTRAPYEKLGKDIEDLKEQLKKDVEGLKEQPDLDTIDTDMRKMAKEIHKMAKKVRELEQAKASIEEHMNERLQLSSNPESQPTIKTEPQESQSESQGTPDAVSKAGKASDKKRKRHQSSSSGNSPRNTPGREDPQQRKIQKRDERRRTSMRVSSNAEVIPID